MRANKQPDWAVLAVPERAVPMGMDEQDAGAMPVHAREVEAEKPIGKKQVSEARETLNKYKSGKAQMDQRILDNEGWWQMRHLNKIIDKQKQETDTPSAFLFNSIANKHADAMDNYPTCSVLPREKSDRDTAEKLSHVLPVVLEHSGFERVYSEAWDYKLKNGMCAYCIMWDKEAENGLGDIRVAKVDILNLFYEPGITDIQRSRNVFYCYMVDTDLLEAMHPEFEGKLGGINENIAKYAYLNGVDTDNKTAVVDWYYKRRNAEGRTVLHLCTFAGDYVLYATENNAETAETGIYNHGKYPFVLDRLFAMEGTLESFGYIDVMKGVQTRIDRQQNAITNYAAKASRLRYFKRDNCGINMEQYKDLTQDFVDVTDGRMDEENLRQIRVDPIDGIYIQLLNNNIEELKSVSGNSDVSQGTASGQMAASAVAALQEAAGKLSRDMIKASYRAYREICLLVIECIRQFYTDTRFFRIVGENGGMEFVGINSKEMFDRGRLPIYDVDVKPMKNSAYSKLAQNELIKEFYGMGFFNPQQADITLSALTMMDFDGKNEMIQMVQKNATVYKQLQALQQLVVQLTQIADPDGKEGVLQELMASGLLNEPGQQAQRANEDGMQQTIDNALGKNNLVEKAKNNTQQMSAPR